MVRVRKPCIPRLVAGLALRHMRNMAFVLMVAGRTCCRGPILPSWLFRGPQRPRMLRDQLVF